MTLRQGVAMLFEVTCIPTGFRLAVKSRVGRRETVRDSTDLASEEELWIELGRLVDQKLAELGLEKTK